MPSLVFHPHPIQKVGILHHSPIKKVGILHPSPIKKSGYTSSLAEPEESPVRDPGAMSNCSSGTIAPCKLEEVARDMDMWEKKDMKVEQVKVETPLDQPSTQNVCFVGVLESVKWFGTSSAS